MQTKINPEEDIIERKYPSLGERIQSTFIDMLLIILLMFIFASILENFENVPDGVRITMFFFVWVVYEPLFTSLGFTLGNYVKGLRVRQRNNTDKKINIIQAFFRYLLKVALGWISFLTIGSNKERRAIHDLAVGSVVIKI